ncbi:MAG TPA: hypothetical protein VFG01_12485 [Acidobacteriota bacterium]|nr:hypothetical protein [Acidobacteriota bacterium]
MFYLINRMTLKKFLAPFFTIFLFAILLYPQSLVELAKKEKERRAKLSGQPSIVLTNADLKKIKKGAALITSNLTLPQENQSKSLPLKSRTLGPKVNPLQNRDQIDQREFDSRSKRYGTKVLDSTERVQSPSSSLYKPDGSFAKVEYYGFLDLELEAENKNGPDIGVYARRQQTGVLPFTLNYALFAMDNDGEWKYLGTGSGIQSPEVFELGEVSATQKIRILFRDYTDTNTIKRIKPHSEEYYMEIDAVEYLHF